MAHWRGTLGFCWDGFVCLGSEGLEKCSTAFLVVEEEGAVRCPPVWVAHDRGGSLGSCLGVEKARLVNGLSIKVVVN
jgi:hypothetical protein